MPYRKLLLSAVIICVLAPGVSAQETKPIPRRHRPDLRKSSLSEAGFRAEA